jgi:hypothetical protein
MSIRNRTSALAFGLVFAAVVASGTIALPAQEPAPGNSTGPVKSPATKRVVDPSRRVPSFFGQIGLTAEQKETTIRNRARMTAIPDSAALGRQAVPAVASSSAPSS